MVDKKVTFEIGLRYLYVNCHIRSLLANSYLKPANKLGKAFLNTIKPQNRSFDTKIVSLWHYCMLTLFLWN